MTSHADSLTFAIAVHGSPYASQASHHALRLCEALIESGHRIARIFFFHEGVFQALSSRVTPQDESDVTAAWQTFAAAHEVELAVCIANALKRGVVSDTEATRYEREASTLAEPFELVGLGQLIEAVASADRYVEIPA